MNAETTVEKPQEDKVALMAEALAPCPRCSKAPIKATTGAQPGTIALLCEDGHAWGMTAAEYQENLKTHLKVAASQEPAPDALPEDKAAAEAEAKNFATVTVSMDRRNGKVQIKHATTGPVEAFGMLELAKVLIASSARDPKVAIAVAPKLVDPKTGRPLS